MSELTPTPPVWIYADVVCDLFHFGHVEFFGRARALGDRLIVGVVGDADVRTYKPAPVMSFEERVGVVAGCRFVDRVLDQPAPLHCTGAFLDAIGAAYCCHGDDMTAEQLHYWYGDLALTGRLKTVPYTPRISTRLIFARVAECLRVEAVARQASASR
ncbi:MAG: adenylyltransferase/cytidyltransferase family protein [Xanthobacteraceae bacterium]|jgi:cytidyltransferase-like protein